MRGFDLFALKVKLEGGANIIIINEPGIIIINEARNCFSANFNVGCKNGSAIQS